MDDLNNIEKSLKEVVDYKDGENEGFRIVTLMPAFENGDRPETGPMQFGADWPGMFMRGDYACMMGMTLQGVIESINNGEAVGAIHLKVLEGLAQTLQSCNIANMKEDSDG